MDKPEFTLRAYLTQAISISYVDLPRIQDAKEGFWINAKHQFTRGNDAKYWIPPAQVLFVEDLTNNG